MKRSVVMIAPFNTRSGYGDHARSIYYSIMDREDLDIKCLDVKLTLENITLMSIR